MTTGDEPGYAHPDGTVICPRCDRGEWVIITASGAEHLLDTRDPTAVTITQVKDPESTEPGHVMGRD